MFIFDILPTEIQQYFLLKCHYDDIINYGLSCKRGLEIIKDDYFWRNKAFIHNIPTYILNHDQFNISKRYGQILKTYGENLLDNINQTTNIAILKDDKYIINFIIENKKPDNKNVLGLLKWTIVKKESDICEKLIFLLDKENISRDYVKQLYKISIKLSKNGMVEPLLLILKEMFQTNKNYKVYFGQYIELFQQTLENVCELNDLSSVKTLVENFSYWPDYLNIGLCTFLEKGNVEGFKYLLSKYTGSYQDLINFTIVYGNLLDEEVLKLLTVHGFNGYYPNVFHAIENHNCKIIKWLLSNYELSNGEITYLLKIMNDRNIRDQKIKNILINRKQLLESES